MSWIPSILLRPHSGALVVLGGSALGGAAYRYTQTSGADDDVALNPHSFTPYTLLHKQSVSSSTAIFTLRNREGKPDSESVNKAWKRSVWSVQAKQPQLQIARAYTPLPPASTHANSSGEDDSDRDVASQDLRLFIKKEEGGEVSTYLHKLPDHSTVELRGPNHECDLPRGLREVIFLAGGTGIAPAMQVASILSERPGSRMHILWANRRREECVGGISDQRVGRRGGRSAHLPSIFSGWRSWFGGEVSLVEQRVEHGAQALSDKASGEETTSTHTDAVGKGVIVQELDALKKKWEDPARPHGLTVDYFVDEEKSFICPADVAKQLQLEAKTDELTEQKEKGSRLILISGPDGFIEYWAGKKLWVGGREVQGELGGVLGQMDLKGWKVFKL